MTLPQTSSPATDHDAAHPSAAPSPGQPGPVVVKKYANRRLYNTESSSYITLDNLAEMVRAGRDFVVYDARSGDDITRGVLTQIIVEEENKGRALLPTAFMRQLIGFYGDSLGGLVPRYLEQTMTAITRQQEQMREAMTQTMGTLLPPGFEEMRRQNVAMMERAMTLFTPFYRQTTQDQTGADMTGANEPGSLHPPTAHSHGAPDAAAGAPTQAQLSELQAEIARLQVLLAAKMAPDQARLTEPAQAGPKLGNLGAAQMEPVKPAEPARAKRRDPSNDGKS